MGLDMYLSKVKRSKKGNDLEEIMKVNHYLTWLDRGKNYSLEDWCGLTEDDVDLDLVKEYESEFFERFYSWDTKKRYPNKSIDVMICDWRKANQIHNWFVQNVQNGVDDCGAYEVAKEQLEQLLEICTNVLAHSKLIKGSYQDGEFIEDSSYAEFHLPCTSGFFFGSTEYDQWYYEDVKHTKEELEKILKETDFENEIVFYSSSW